MHSHRLTGRGCPVHMKTQIWDNIDWQHHTVQTITWTNVVLSTVRSTDIHLRTNSNEKTRHQSLKLPWKFQSKIQCKSPSRKWIKNSVFLSTFNSLQYFQMKTISKDCHQNEDFVYHYKVKIYMVLKKFLEGLICFVTTSLWHMLMEESFGWKEHITTPPYQWFSARLQYLHCYCTGDTAVLH